MTLVAIFTVMALSFGAIAWPFLTRRVNGDPAPKPVTPLDDLVSQRDTTYQALKELEFEYNLGNLSDADYADLRERYRTQAAGVLQKLDTATADVGPEEAPPAVVGGAPGVGGALGRALPGLRRARAGRGQVLPRLRSAA